MNHDVQLHSLEDGRRGMRRDQLDSCAQQWAAGRNTQEIAAALGISEARVFNRIDEWMPHARRIVAARLEARGGKTPSIVGGIP